MRHTSLILVVLALLVLGMPALANPITILVGDIDGFGLGCASTGTCVWPGPGFSGEPYDGRSEAEKAATNGAQITDVYTALYTNPDEGPNSFTTADVLFAFTGMLTTGTIEIGMGDFQSSEFGAFTASINGFSVPFAFQDGFQKTVVRTFTLTADQIAAANAIGQVVLSLDRDDSLDYVAFDYFKLDGTTAVPDTGSSAQLLLIAFGALGFARKRLMP
jgi:hypothetical protein